MDSDLPEGCPLSVQGHTFLLSVKRKFFIGLDNISGGPPENDRMRNGAATVSVYWRIWRRRESFMTPAHVSSVGPTQTVCGALKGLCPQILLFIGLRVARNLHCASFLLSIESQVQQTQSHHTHIICLPNADLSLEAVDWYVALITPTQSFSSYDLILVLLSNRLAAVVRATFVLPLWTCPVLLARMTIRTVAEGTPNVIVTRYVMSLLSLHPTHLNLLS